MGYQVVEVPIIDKLIRSELGKDMEIIIILWVVYNLRIELNKSSLPIKIDLIRVTYISTYPAIGIKYLDDELPDQEEFIIERSHFFIKNMDFMDFYTFVINNKSWIREEMEEYYKD